MRKQKLKTAFVVIVCLMFILLVATGYSEQSDAVFATDAFYEGDSADEIDYKQLYDSWYVGLAPGSNDCKSEMEQAVEGTAMENGAVIEICMTASAQWIAPHRISSNLEMGADQHTITPYADGDVIISPGTLKFLNQNITLNEDGEPYIEAILNNSYKVRWDNINCWWCHIGKENKNKHSVRIGKGGSYSQCTQGYIIGEARAETIVSFFQLDDNGAWIDATAGDVLGRFN